MEASMMACGSKEKEWGLDHSTMLTVMSFKEIGGMIKCTERFFNPTLFSVSILSEMILLWHSIHCACFLGNCMFADIHIWDTWKSISNFKPLF